MNGMDGGFGWRWRNGIAVGRHGREETVLAMKGQVVDGNQGICEKFRTLYGKSKCLYILLSQFNCISQRQSDWIGCLGK